MSRPGITNTAPTSFESEAASPRRWLVLFAMTGSLCMIFLDITVVSVALQRMQGDLGLGESGAQWAMNAYTLTIAALVALGGRLADSIGRVRCFVTGVVIFAVASACCGLAIGTASLLAARVAQGVGAALMQPSSSTIVINSFAPGERGKAMGVYVGIPMAFLALGPVIGGLLTEYASWRACFLINVPIAATAIALTVKARPVDGPRTAGGFDPRAALVYLAGLPVLVFGLQQSGPWGWSNPLVSWSVVIGLALVVLFVLLEWRRTHPLLAVRLFEEKGFLGCALVLFCMQFAMTGQIISMSEYFQSGLGFSPARAGAALLPMLVPVLVVVHVAGRMYDRHGARRPVLIGTILAATGLAVEALAVPGARYLPVAAGMFLFGLGIGFVMSPTNTDALSRVGAERRGQASGLLGTVRQVAGSAGIAAIGAAVIFVQSNELARHTPDSTIFHEAAHGDLEALAHLADQPEELAHARRILMTGTAAGQWTAFGSIAFAVLAAAIFVQGSSARREPASAS